MMTTTTTLRVTASSLGGCGRQGPGHGHGHHTVVATRRGPRSRGVPTVVVRVPARAPAAVTGTAETAADADADAVEDEATETETGKASVSVASDPASLYEAKMKLLRYAAATDRGQLLFNQPAYAPLDKYSADEGAKVQSAIDTLVKSREGEIVDETLVDGTWELVYASKQLFRSSPFFMAIEAAFGDATHSSFLSDGEEVLSSELFFRLHELQVKSWGASTVGRVKQTIDLGASSLISSFDTILFALTTIPIIGFGKMLPTFGAEVKTFSDNVITSHDDDGALVVSMQVDRTQVLEREGIPRPPFPLPNLLGVNWPVKEVWKLLPWNQQKLPTCTTRVVFCDDDFRINQDIRESYFVYMRVDEPLAATDTEKTD